MGCEISNEVDQNAQYRNRQLVYPQNQQNNGYQIGVQQQNASYQQSAPYPQANYVQPQYQPGYNYQPIPQPQGSTHQNQPYQYTSSQNKENHVSTTIVPVKKPTHKVNANNIDKKTLKVTDRRGLMHLYASKEDNFLSHHLKSQIHLSKYAQGNWIKRRQILEHNRFEVILARGYGSNINNYNQFATKAYFQRIMLQIFETADKQFFEQGKSYDQVRLKIAQRYLFEIYQNKEFLDAGLGRYTCFNSMSQLPMSSTALASDTALYPVLRFLKQKYPQVADNSQIRFPEVKQKKNDINLLNNFPSKCYSSQGLVNVQTLFADLKFMIDRSVEQFADFQKDMKAILGDQVLTDSKVKRITKNGATQYSASPVRRVFIKWAQTILQRIPDILLSQAFLQFIKSKSIISNNFYFKSTVQPTTHGKVIEVLCELLQAAKYQISNLAKKKQFGFFIYDLLRCKTKRNSGEQICQLLKKMEQTKVTPSGKKFEVVRIKDRFKTPNRDLMVNFRYGDIIVAEAQLCIDTSDVTQKTKKTNKFNHYIYELERGLFGPTIQLIMQYQDAQRKDISANLKAQGIVKKRTSKKPLQYLKKANRKCFNSHDMIQLKGNLFIANDGQNYDTQLDFTCDYCLRQFKCSQVYHYCYYCTITMCTSCGQSYKNQKVKQIKLICNLENMITPLSNIQDLSKYMNQCPIVLFYTSDSAPSTLLKDLITYNFCVNKMQKKKNPKVYSFCCDSKESESVCNQLNITQFPTTVVFSQDGNIQTTLIGSSWTLVEGIYEVQQKLLQNLPKALEINCLCGNQLSQLEYEDGAQLFCVYCGNTDNGQGNNKVFACQAGHYRCYTCSFLGLNQPSAYRDIRGASYLCSKKQNPKLPKCTKGHATIYAKKIQIVCQMSCFKCNKLFVFNDELGAGHCVQCKTYCCHSCIGINDDRLQQTQHELVNHTIQTTAQQGQKCICKRLFKKVYNTRDYTYDINQQQVQNQDRSRQMFQAIYNQQPKRWTCIICERQKNDGQLHLACFLCPVLKQQKRNVQICIECAIGSDLLNKQLQQKVGEVPTSFVCKSNHPTVRTSQCFNQGDMTYDCNGCKKTFYVYTERYYCKTCKVNCCLQCSKTQLKNINPPKCLRKCNQNHDLIVRQDTDTLRLCDGCKTTIRKVHFACPRECGFQYCLDCAATPPGVDTSANRMQHLNQDKIKKQLQAYERGWVDQLFDEQDQQNIQNIAQSVQNGANQIENGLNAIQSGLNDLADWFDS